MESPHPPVPVCTPTSHVGERSCLMVTPKALPGLANKKTSFSVTFEFHVNNEKFFLVQVWLIQCPIPLGLYNTVLFGSWSLNYGKMCRLSLSVKARM